MKPTFVQFQWGGYLHQQNILWALDKPGVQSAADEVRNSIAATFQHPERIEIEYIRYEAPDIVDLDGRPIA